MFDVNMAQDAETFRIETKLGKKLPQDISRYQTSRIGWLTSTYPTSLSSLYESQLI